MGGVDAYLLPPCFVCFRPCALALRCVYDSVPRVGCFGPVHVFCVLLLVLHEYVAKHVHVVGPSCVRRMASSAPSERAKYLWITLTPPHPHIVCVHRSHGVPPLPPPSQVPCAHCVWFHLVCLSCTHVLHTPYGYPHVQPTPPYGRYRNMWILCAMPTWACNGECRDMRCTSSSSSTHMPDALPIHTPTHMIPPCAHILFPYPSNMSTVRCAYHGKALVHVGIVMQRALWSAKV